MRKVSEMSVIQIEITNVCDRSCSNCTRFCGHFIKDRIFFVDVDYFRKAVNSLVSYQGIVGMIGGEPTLHPKFAELCHIFQELRPDKAKRGLWSNTRGKFNQYRTIINETFGYFNLNDHSTSPVIHTPVLVASEDMISDPLIRWSYIQNCWVQNTWSAPITPKGVFFCEVAGMLSLLFDGPTGWDIEKDPEWWRKPISDYGEQIDWACSKCSCALLLLRRSCTDLKDDLSATNLKRLQQVDSPKIRRGEYEIYSKGLHEGQPRDATWYWGRSVFSWPRRLYRKIIRYARRLPRGS